MDASAAVEIPKPNRRRRKLAKIVSTVRNSASALKDIGILSIFALLVVRPEAVIKFVTDRKIDNESLSFYDIKMPFDEGLKELEVQGELRQTASRLSAGATSGEVGRFLQQVSRVEPEIVAKIEADILNAQKAQRYRDWAAVLASCATLTEAQEQAARLLKTYPSAKVDVYLREGAYRVIWFLGTADGWADVRFQLRRFPQRFVVRMDKWCSNWATTTSGTSPVSCPSNDALAQIGKTESRLAQK